MKSILETLKSLTRTSDDLDPGQFGDPVAMMTEWTPLKSGGTNFRTHRLVLARPDRAEFRLTLGAKLFCGVFAGFGLGAMIVAPAAMASGGDLGFRFESFIFPLVGSLFCAIGVGLFVWMGRPVVFDWRDGWFWKGKTSPLVALNPTNTGKAAPLSEIHALQIVTESVQGDNGSYHSYELNAVLKDGRRVNVVDHGNIRALRGDAEQLSTMLAVPLWDVTTAHRD